MGRGGKGRREPVVRARAWSKQNLSQEGEREKIPAAVPDRGSKAGEIIDGGGEQDQHKFQNQPEEAGEVDLPDEHLILGVD